MDFGYRPRFRFRPGFGFLIWISNFDPDLTSDISFTDLKTGETLSLVMYEYTDWPDHGVPGSVESLLRVLQSLQKSFAASKMVVHSSTGVGRTGTFFALHKLMQLVDANVRHLDIFQIVLGLRRQRKFMVNDF